MRNRWRHAPLPTYSDGENADRKKLTEPHSIQMVISGLRRVLVLACVALWSGPLTGPISSAFAQANPDNKPNDQQKPADAKKSDAARWADELAEDARVLPGPASNPECIWLGKRVISLLFRDDLDTAQRHLTIYDRFGCPGAHIRQSFSCLTRQGPLDNKATDALDDRVRECWRNPTAAVAPAAAAATTAPPATPTTAGTGQH